jgi:hypothetical protein
MDSLHYIYHLSFLLTPAFPPVAEAVFFPFVLFSTPFSFDCNKLVRSDPRGLSIGNGKGSVITFNIYVTPTEEDKEVPTVFSGTSCTFTSAGAKIEDFRFLGAKSFDSAVFLFLAAL